MGFMVILAAIHVACCVAKKYQGHYGQDGGLHDFDLCHLLGLREKPTYNWWCFRCGFLGTFP